MDSDERVALINRMVGLVNQLYLLETCCPQPSCGYKNPAQTNNFAQAKNRLPVLDCVPCYPAQKQAWKAHQNCVPQPKTSRNLHSNRASTSTKTQEEPKPCFLLKCQPHKCQTDPDNQPLITWTPVMEIRRTTNAKHLERQNDDPLAKYVVVEPPECPYKPVWSTIKEPTCEKHYGPPQGYLGLGPPPGHNGALLRLCCLGGKDPPVDRCGQPYECKQTLDGRAVCKPTTDVGPTDWCDAKTSPFRRCDAKEDTRKILMRSKVLNQRFAYSDRANGKYSSSTSSYKRPVYPGMNTCVDGICRCPDNPNRQNSKRSSVKYCCWNVSC